MSERTLDRSLEFLVGTWPWAKPWLREDIKLGVGSCGKGLLRFSRRMGAGWRALCVAANDA